MASQKKNYDSAFCGSLPLHNINLIQPHGLLVVVRKEDMQVIQVSENIERIMGISPVQFAGTALSGYLNADEFGQLKSWSEKEVQGKIPFHLSLRWRNTTKEFLALAHARPEYLLLEMEEHSIEKGAPASFISVYQELKYTMSAIEAAKTIEEASNIAVHEIKKICGFDKVMIYRFDKDWNGKVIAEIKEPGMAAYMDLVFPASDVPKQARELYLRNPYRLIPNRSYEPVKLYPVINPVTGSFTDLSGTNIRAVAAVHLEYMKNMEIMASMSTRLMQDENHLWGLISCHHRTPHYLSYELCTVLELLSGIISTKIVSLRQKEEYQANAEAQEVKARLIKQVYTANDLVKGLLDKEVSLLQLLKADGVAIHLNGRTSTAGEVPAKEHLKELLLWLQSLNIETLYTEDCLSAVFEDASGYTDKASGIAVVPVHAGKGDMIVFFRREVIQQINWGGNPDEAIQFENNSATYHPRNSFRQWKQQVKHTALPWKHHEIAIAGQFRNFITEYLLGISRQ